jgi:ribosomal-protein-serine acetyltransferase
MLVVKLLDAYNIPYVFKKSSVMVAINMSDYSKNFYPLSIGDGIEMKALGVSDVEAFWAFVLEDRAHLEEFDSFVKEFQSVDDVYATLSKIQSLREQGKSLTCGIWDGDRLIGFMNGGFDDSGGLHMGYSLARKYEGRGIMTRAGRAILGYAFAEVQMPYAWLDCWVTNTRSMRLAERLGFRAEDKLIPPDPGSGSPVAQRRYVLTNRVVS